MDTDFGSSMNLSQETTLEVGAECGTNAFIVKMLRAIETWKMLRAIEAWTQEKEGH